MLVIMRSVGGDGTRVEGRDRPALMRPLGMALHVPMLPPLSFASLLIKAPTPCWFLVNKRKVGPAGLELGKKISKFFCEVL